MRKKLKNLIILGLVLGSLHSGVMTVQSVSQRTMSATQRISTTYYSEIMPSFSVTNSAVRRPGANLLTGPGGRIIRPVQPGTPVIIQGIWGGYISRFFFM